VQGRGRQLQLFRSCVSAFVPHRCECMCVGVPHARRVHQPTRGQRSCALRAATVALLLRQASGFGDTHPKRGRAQGSNDRGARPATHGGARSDALPLLWQVPLLSQPAKAASKEASPRRRTGVERELEHPSVELCRTRSGRSEAVPGERGLPSACKRIPPVACVRAAVRASPRAAHEPRAWGGGRRVMLSASIFIRQTPCATSTATKGEGEEQKME
jgi:hypothetical protein